jgi:hypothetical protein
MFVPSFAGNPANSQSIKAIGAGAGGPLVDLRDTYTRLLFDVTPSLL